MPFKTDERRLLRIHRVADNLVQDFFEVLRLQIIRPPDEYSLVLESVREEETLLPIAETTGAGGAKWFMVKTSNGNVGWVKDSNDNRLKKLESHFRSLPSELSVLQRIQARELTKTTKKADIAIPVQIRGSKIIVPVTFNHATTANLLLDTGASQTMISKRIARDLRLYSSGSGTRYGIGGSVMVSTAQIDSLKVGEAEMRNILVSIHDFSLDSRYEGLLGFDFLGNFQMSLDSQRSMLALTPSKR